MRDHLPDHARPAAMSRDTGEAHWDRLPESAQLALSGKALRQAAETIADQAEALAREMADGAIADRGGPDALRLLAAIVRVTGRDAFVPAGSA
jgi:hypothetical protein